MTEDEFRAAVDQSVARQQGKGLGWSYGQAAVEAARQAGLEFAPEPAKLPEQLLAGRCPVGQQLGMVLGTFIGIDAFDRLKFVCPHGDAYELAQVIAARYNAYPALRAAAERVIQEGDNGADRNQYEPFTQALGHLERTLLAGPKP